MLVVLMIRHVIIRHVNLRVVQVLLMVVQEILMINIKVKKMTITLTLHLKNDIIESKLEEDVINRLVSKKITQSNQSGYV